MSCIYACVVKLNVHFVQVFCDYFIEISLFLTVHCITRPLTPFHLLVNVFLQRCKHSTWNRMHDRFDPLRISILWDNWLINCQVLLFFGNFDHRCDNDTWRICYHVFSYLSIFHVGLCLNILETIPDVWDRWSFWIWLSKPMDFKHTYCDLCMYD